MFEIFSTLLIVITIFYVAVIMLFIAGLFIPNERRQKKQYYVSIVIAARNEEKNISNILDDLIKQSYPKDKFEIIIVDDHSTDKTYEIVQQFKATNDNIRILHAEVNKTSKLTAKKNALSYGIKHSNGEIILSTDADCRVKPKWIETMVSYFTDEVGMVVGYSQIKIDNNYRSLFKNLQAIDFLALLAGAQGSLNLNFPLAATGQNLAYRREAFKQIEGFNDISHRISGDDVLLLQLIRKRTNWQIRFASSKDAYNYTYPEHSFNGFISQRNRWASNGSYQIKLNLGFFFIVVNTYLMNLLLLIHVPISFAMSKDVNITLSCLLFKIIIEFFLILKGAHVYNRTELIKYFPIWAILQIPYVVLVGFLGNVSKFVWKGRTS